MLTKPFFNGSILLKIRKFFTHDHRESIHAYEYAYAILLEPDEDGGFVVTCPALPGLVTHGDTIAQARAHAAEAIEVYVECLKAEGSPSETTFPNVALS